MHSPMPAILYDIKEYESIISIVFSVKLGLVKLIFLVDVIFWRMDIVLFD